MVVRTLGSGRSVTGLYIGTRNARRHFARDLQRIDLQLGHVQIGCTLSPEFWRGRPEIRDPRLADWLFMHILHSHPSRAPVPIALVAKGGGTFRVLPFTMPAASADGLSGFGVNHPGSHKETPMLRYEDGAFVCPPPVFMNRPRGHGTDSTPGGRRPVIP